MLYVMASLPQDDSLKAETRAVWEQLFDDITMFDDFRQFKAEQGGVGPDFRHKETGLGLW